VRRSLAILFVLFFGSGSILPAFALVRAQNDLPLCCRKEGAHHCKTPGDAKQSEAANGQSLQATCLTPHPVPAANLVAKFLVNSKVEVIGTGEPSHNISSFNALKPMQLFQEDNFGRGPPLFSF
jgi:hypothetical protein